jgi:hypothetical protein
MQLLSLITFVASATAAALPAALEERAACTFANPAALVKAKAAFQAAKIVPDVIPRFDPTPGLSVAYGNKAVNLTFNLRNCPRALLQHHRRTRLPRLHNQIHPHHG